MTDKPFVLLKLTPQQFAKGCLGEIRRLRAENERLREEMAEWKSAHAATVELRGLVESHMDMARGDWECVATIERLETALVQIENWVGKLPSTMGEAALIFEYIEQACAVLDRD